MPGRGAADLALQQRRERDDDPCLLGQHLSNLPDESAMYDRKERRIKSWEHEHVVDAISDAWI